MKTIRNPYILLLLAAVMALWGCSSTKGVPDGDRLYIGMKKIDYRNYEKNDHFTTTQEELEAALATAPNGALFGSSYHRTPFPYGLWIWNAFSDKDSRLSKWITKSFGKKPVLMSWVNPELRASVGKEVLRANGYFRGQVDYEVIDQKNPKEAKIAYTATMNHLFTIDSLQYLNFPPEADSLIAATKDEARIHDGDAFSVSALESERSRITRLLRNNGYYYYQTDYAFYLADTVNVPGKVLLHFQMADSLPSTATRKWYIGKVDINMRRQMREQLDNAYRRRGMTIHFAGRKPRMRSRVIVKDLKLRPKKLYNYDDYLESVSKLTANEVFSMVDFKFTPRDTAAWCDTLDLTLDCVFDKPYDFYIETNVIGKTTGMVGPGAVIGFTKRNAFRGGEKLDVNLYGSYAWQTGHKDEGTDTRFHSYEYGLNASLELPRLLLPFKWRRRWYTTPSTVMKVSSGTVNRSQYFKRHIVSGELTYKFQPNAVSQHEFSPLILQYEYMQRQTDAFLEILERSPYLQISMADQFVPKMRYSYTYSSPVTCLNPIYWRTTVSEASNLLSLGYVIAGEKWSEKGKTMFKNPYAQFFKIETQFRKMWQVGDHSSLVAFADAGIMWSYGNALQAPYSEQFYVGGANSIRAFNVRSIGPGSYYTTDRQASYLDQTGDLKIQFNLEYRPRLFGNLYGAVFLDAGNVWALRDDGYREGSQLQMKNFLKEMALGTGVGIRYDLDYFVIRLDWGIALHVPYKDGFYNISGFKEGQSLHFAIGYPF